jgi:type I restriction enzyme R subunit
LFLHRHARGHQEARGEELDIKPYEADMRHLINTYIQADAATTLGDLVQVVADGAGCARPAFNDAIAKKLNEKGKLSNKAIAEGIINNVRQTIARTHLADPKFYALMSTLLDDLIKQSCKDAAAYAEFLRKAEELIKRLAAGQPLEGVPAVLHGNAEAVTLFNNLGNLPFTLFKCPQDADEKAALVLQIDKAMRNDAPPGWNGDDTKERVVKSFLHKLLQKDAKTTVALFDIIKNLPGYQ